MNRRSPNKHNFGGIKRVACAESKAKVKHFACIDGGRSTVKGNHPLLGIGIAFQNASFGRFLLKRLQFLGKPSHSCHFDAQIEERAREREREDREGENCEEEKIGEEVQKRSTTNRFQEEIMILFPRLAPAPAEHR
jgi:hypothetical protein